VRGAPVTRSRTYFLKSILWVFSDHPDTVRCFLRLNRLFLDDGRMNRYEFYC